ncbi:lipopolysaccharide biosynthesis protein [Sphingomonas oleivorans]|uniref:Lipopolysaccharide biosynthesis protein n=1 Tax=Sphingomonas oleivorans TaxID=1735121 RepID=A0A2T5FZ61_9SPHN|nr:lipopolysaccharide biosynthesis protein [Sphingomonas oleivorans]
MIWSMVESWCTQLLQFVVFMILAHHLDARALGLVAVALLVGQLFQGTLLAGISTPLVRASENDQQLDDTGFVLAAASGVAMVLLVSLLARWIEQLYAMPGLSWVLIALTAANLLTSLNIVHQAWLTRNFQMRPLALRSAVATAAGGGVGIVMAIRGHGVTALVAQNIVAALAGTAILWLSSPWRPSWQFSREKARYILRYGKHLSLTGITNFFNTSSDVLVVGYVLGPAATGIYTVGKRTLLASNMLLSNALSRISLPIFSQLRKDPERMARAFLRLVSATSVVTLPAFVGLALVAPEFIRIFFGDNWGQAVGVMQALSLFGALQALGLFNQAVALAMDKPQWQTALTLLYAIVNVLTFFTAAQYGVIAVAIAFTLRAYLLYPLSVLMVVKLTPVRWIDYLKAVGIPAGGAFAMAAITLLVRQQLDGLAPLPMMIATVIVGAASYAMLMLLFGRSRLADMRVMLFSREKPAA